MIGNYVFSDGGHKRWLLVVADGPCSSLPLQVVTGSHH